MTIVQPKVEPWKEEDIVCPQCGYKQVIIMDSCGGGVTILCNACHTKTEYKTLFDAYKASKNATTMHKE